MACEDQTEWCGGGEAVDLSVLRLIQRSHKEIPIMLMRGDVIELADYNCLIIALYLFVRLWVVCSRCHVLFTEMGAQVAKEFADELCTVVS